MFIILTASQAVSVRGATSAGAALDPVPLSNGTEWALPVSVCTDPLHAVRHAFLGGLPIRDVATEEFPSDPEP